jgi:hypothetical protein
MSICLRRREFIAGLGGAAAWPLAARGQQRVVPVVGYVSLSTAAEPLPTAAFRKGLSETGYAEGQNVSVAYTGWMVNSIACRRCWPSWFAVVWPPSPRLAWISTPYDSPNTIFVK